MSKLSVSLLSVGLLSACIVGDDGSDDGDELSLAAGGSPTGAIRVVQHNIEKKQAVLEQTIHHAMDIKAHAITLQEVCPSELAWLHANLDGRWTIGSELGKHVPLSGCDQPDGTHAIPSNVVIWTGGTGGKVTTYAALSQPAEAPGGMVCVEFKKATVPVHVCSAHLISADWVDPVTHTSYDGMTVRLQQATKIKQIARDEWFGGAKNEFGIVAGDLNGTPDTAPFDKLYDAALGGTGDFTEYNRTGASRAGMPTAHADGKDNMTFYSKKIDYVFFSTNRAAIDGPAVEIKEDASDHDRVTSVVHMTK